MFKKDGLWASYLLCNDSSTSFFHRKGEELSIVGYAIPLNKAHLIRRSPTTELKQEVFGFA